MKYSHLAASATFLALSVSSLISAPSLADTVILKNGQRIDGNIMLMRDPAALRFHTSTNESIRISWDEIETLYNAQGQAVALPDFAHSITAHNNTAQSHTAQAPAASYGAPAAPSSYTAATTAAITTTSTSTNAPTSANTQPDDDADLWGAKWTGRVNIGTSLQTGNSEKSSIDVDAMTQARWGEIHRAKLDVSYDRVKDSGTVTEDNKSITGTYDYFFDKQWFLNSSLSFAQDDIAQIDLRTLAGIGIGYQMYEQDDLNLKFILGPSYLREKYANRSTESSIAAHWETGYDQKFYDGLFQLFHDHELIIPSNEAKAYIFDSSTGVRIPLRMGLVATGQIDFDWQNRPAPGVKKDDTKYSFKLGYEW